MHERPARVRELLQADPAAALSEALDAWREHRHPSIAAVIRMASASALERFEPPRMPRSREGFQEAWLALAAADPSPVATGWLAAHLDHLVPVAEDRFGMLRANWMAEKHAALLARLAKLRERGPDPRIADAAIGMIRDGRYGYWDLRSVEQLYRPILELAESAGDEATGEELRELARTPRSKRATVRQWIQEALPPAADRLALLRRMPLDPGLADAWLALCPSGRTSSGRDVGDLYREILASPADDEVRHVYADALLEQGDPRGTFVSLQLSGVPSDDPRIRKLLKDHQAGWLGEDLSATLQHFVFRRGFPDEAELRSNAVASREIWEAASRDERLATVRALRQGKGNRENYLRFLLSEQMRDLRQAEIPTAAFLDRLAEGPPRPFEALLFARPPNRKQLARIATEPAFAGVRTLGLGEHVELASILTQLAAAGLTERLTGIEVRASWRAVGQDPILPRLDLLIERIPGLSHLRIVSLNGAPTSLFRGGDGWTIELSATSTDGRYLTVSDQSQWWQLADVEGVVKGGLPPLPAVVAAVRVVGSVRPNILARITETWGLPVEQIASS